MVKQIFLNSALALMLLTMVPHNDYYRIYDNLHPENDGIIGTGWTIADAAADYLGKLGEGLFYDDGTPITVRDGDLEFERRIILDRSRNQQRQ